MATVTPLQAPSGTGGRGLVKAAVLLLVVLVGAIGVAVLARDEKSPAVRTTSATVDQPPAVAHKKSHMAPLPKSKPRLVQPVAGESTGPPVDLPVEKSADQAEPKISGPASTSKRGAVAASQGVSGLNATSATALPNGIALPPLKAPQAVLEVIQAGNVIARSPYKWGGGHGNFQDSGYDCSGSVTYALYRAGLIRGSATSGQLMGYGKSGPGKWISIYANPGHVYMMVAGIRFDTVAKKLTGSRWQNSPVSAAGKYEVRHPAGF